MKVLLISSNTTALPYPIYPLGMSMVASALIKAGHEARQFDMLEAKDDPGALAREIESFVPALVGISVRNIDNTNLANEQYYMDTVKDLVGGLRRLTEAKVVLGGAGFSLVPELILGETEADFGIVGEGESLMVEFADNAEKGIYPEKRIIGPECRLSEEEMPSAEYDGRLLGFYLRSGGIASVQTKRGCTHKCIYCSYPVLEGPKIRRRLPGAVVDDIETLRDRHNAKYLFFTDSVFNDDEGAYLEVLKEMLRRGVKMPWTGFFKPLGMSEEIVDMMLETGLSAVEIGSDAATDLTLKKLGKGFSFKDIQRCGEMLGGREIPVSHYFMFGGPGETKETVIEGIENILGLKECVVFIFMGIRILPNTPLARTSVKENIISPEDGMLRPIYYVSPLLEKKWLEETLTSAFANTRHCVFPPDTFDSSLRALHALGHSGALWDLLLPKKRQNARNRHRPARPS